MITFLPEHTEKDGTRLRSLMCPKCYQTVPYTVELEEKLNTLIAALEQEKKDRGAFKEKVQTAENVSISLSTPNDEKGGDVK